MIADELLADVRTTAGSVTKHAAAWNAARARAAYVIPPAFAFVYKDGSCPRMLGSDVRLCADVEALRETNHLDARHVVWLLRSPHAAVRIATLAAVADLETGGDDAG